MKLDRPSRLECHGKVKFSGYGIHGSLHYKDGRLVVYNHNGLWKLDVVYTVNANAVRTFRLNSRTLSKVICKGTLLVNLLIDSTHYSVYYQPINGDFSPMKTIAVLLEDIRTGREGSEDKPSPARLGLTGPVKTVNGWSPSPQNQNQNFTSVKDSNKKLTKICRFSDDENDENKEEGKENIDSNKREKPDFLERGLSKAQQNSTASFCKTKSFYGEDKNRFGSFGLSSTYKRKPGLMPDPSPSKGRLSDVVPYSWSRNKPAIQSTDQQPQSFQGFSNLGNTCYMNAILQSLFSLDSFTADISIGNNKLLRSLPQTSLYSSLCRLHNSRKKYMSEFTKKEYLKNVKSAISSSAKRFLGYQQHDAHEFLGQVLDQLKEEVNKVNNSTPSPHREGSEVEGRSQEVINPTTQNFEFEVEHTISCTECGEEVKKAEQFNDISLEMPRRRDGSKQCSLQNALDLFFKKEKLEYKCEKCGCTDSEVKHKFTKLPRVLILHLKRYSYCSSATFQVKMLQSIHINKYLTLDAHCTESTRPAYPTMLPELKCLSSSYTTSDDSSDTRDDSQTPRRKLNLSTGFKFKKSRPLSEVKSDDHSTTSRPDTSTPYKRIRLANKEEFEESEKKPMKVITLSEDEEGDPELAKALELSLQESKENYDEVDGDTERDVQKAIEMSRLGDNHTKQSDHEYTVSIHEMTEEEQLRLAIEESMRDWEASAAALEKSQQCNSTVEDMDVSTDQQSISTDETVRQPIKTEGSVSEQCDTDMNEITMEVSDSNSDEESGSNTRRDCLESDVIRECAAEVLKSKQGCLELACDTVISLDDEERSSNGHVPEESSGETYDGSSKYFNNTDVKSESFSSPAKSAKRRDIKFKMSHLKQRYSPYKGGSKESIAKEGQKENTENEEAERRKSEQSSVHGDICPDNAAVNVKLEEKTQHVNPEVDTSVVPKLSSDADFQYIEDEKEEDLLTLLDDWPENKENEQPCGIAMETNDKEINSTNFIDDLPHVDNEKGDLPYSYRLVSIVNHIGSSSVAGHYVSDVHSIQKHTWYSCDDNHVTKMSESEIRDRRERSGYIFFYLSKDIYEDLKDHFSLTQEKS